MPARRRVPACPNVRVNAVAPGVVAFPESGYEADPEAQARQLRGERIEGPALY